ncbi:MAG: DUF6266 family protein, partial [Bacteroidota bacterium]|nr:DUF6266 family protein [Bacteroidota bacterium]
RSQSFKRKTTSTIDQLDHQLKFSTVVGFVQPMTGLLGLTFKRYANGMSEYNAAFSYNYQNALSGKAPDYTIKYSRALVSRGDLPNATAPAATVSGTSVYFTWTDNSGTGKAANTDKAVLIAYSEDVKQTHFSTTVAVRGDGAATLDVTNFKGSTIQTWIAFLSADGKEAANSFYTGELVIS